MALVSDIKCSKVGANTRYLVELIEKRECLSSFFIYIYIDLRYFNIYLNLMYLMSLDKKMYQSHVLEHLLKFNSFNF